MDKRSLGLFGVVLALILFFGVNVLANAALRTVRLDLTREKLFTLSDGSRQIASNLDEPIRLYLYISQAQARDVPGIKDYSERVRDVLESYVLHSDGNLILEVIDPEPYSEAEEQAVREGIAGIPIGTGDSLYFGLVGTNATDGREVIPYFDAFNQEKERFLEYDISRLIYSLAHPDKQRLGVLSSLPISGGPPAMPFAPQPAQGRWKILDQLEAFFELETVDPGTTEIDSEIDLLLVVHPRAFADTTLYAIDQFVLGGGKLVAFTDPHCEADQTAADPTNPMSQFGASRGSDLNRLFQAWGFEMIPNKAIGDRENSLRVNSPDGNRMVPLDYVIWMRITDEGIDDDDPITSLLTEMMLAAPGGLRQTPEATTTFTPLLRTSEDAMEIDVGRLQFRPDPKGLLASFVPGYQSLILAARVSGPVTTAFPDGRPTDAPVEASVEGTEVEASADLLHLAESTGPIHVIAVADVDMLADRWWVQEQSVMGLSLGLRKISDNGDFLVNAIENLLGGEELISIRARGRFSRPFDRVEDLRRSAEQDYLSQQVELERRLQEAESRINELQTQKTGDSTQFLSPEQRSELTRAQDDMLDTKRKLRDVRHELQKDIDSLGMRLKWINILLIPALVSAAAVAMGALRIRRRGT